MDGQTIIARRVAKELRTGDLVNLGIGIPTLVANYVPPDLKVFFQSENGLIGTGPIPEQGMAHPLLTDAGGRPISALPGASTFDSAMSFGLIRGGHLDVTVIGGLTLIEIAPGVTVDEVRNNTHAELVEPEGLGTRDCETNMPSSRRMSGKSLPRPIR